MMNQGIDQGVAQRVDAYRGNPQALQQKYAVSQELVDLLALQKIKSEKEAAARQMQMQMAQQQAANGEPPTVAEQREKEVMDMTKEEMVQQQSGIMQQKQQQQQEGMQKLAQGIASAPGAQMAAQPQMMAAGGIVAFAEGGDTSPFGRAVDNFKGSQLGKGLKGAGLMPDIEDDAKARALRKALVKKYGTSAGVAGAFKAQSDEERQKATEILNNLDSMSIEEMEQALSGAASTPTPQPSAGVDNRALLNQADAALRSAPAATAAPAALAAPEPETVVPAPAPVAEPPPALLRPSSAAPQQALPNVGLPSLPQGGQFDKDVRAGVQGLMDKDPNAMEKATRKEGLEFLGMPQAERDARAKQRAGIEALDAQQLDPEQIRKQKLQNFMLGAGGQGSFGRALGAGGRSAVNFERNRDDEQRRRLLERNKMLRDEFDIDAGVRKDAYASGEKRFGEGAADVRQGISSGASMSSADQQAAASMRNTDVSAAASIRNSNQQMETAGLDRGSRERIAEMQAQVQQETSAALRASATEQERNRAYGNAETRRIRAEKEAGARFDKQIANIQGLAAMGQKLNPTQETMLDQLIADREKAVRAAVGPIDAEMDRLASVGAGGGGDGLKVVGKRDK